MSAERRRRWGTYANVELAGAAVQENIEGTKEAHEGRDAGRATQGNYIIQQFAAQHDRITRPRRLGASGRAKSVGRFRSAGAPASCFFQ